MKGPTSRFRGDDMIPHELLRRQQRRPLTNGNTADGGPPEIALGDRSGRIRDLQAQLRTIGFDPEVDGLFGPETQRTVRQFQEGYGFQQLRTDGSLDRQTLDAIEFCASRRGKLSPHFYFGEFRSKTTGMIRVRRSLPLRLERLRHRHSSHKRAAGELPPGGQWALPVLNGYKSPGTADHRRGVNTSRHLHGEAVDIPTAYDLTKADLDDYGPLFSGVGLYDRDGRVRHLDIAGAVEGSQATSKTEGSPRVWSYDPAWNDGRDHPSLHIETLDQLQRAEGEGEGDRTFTLDASVDGDVIVTAPVPGTLHITGTVGGNLVVRSRITGNLVLDLDTVVSVWGDRPIESDDDPRQPHACDIEGDLNVGQRCTTEAEVTISASVGGFCRVFGTIGRSLNMAGRVLGTLSVKGSGKIARNLWISGGYGLRTLTGSQYLDLAGRDSYQPIAAPVVFGDLLVDGSIGRSLGVSGGVSGTVWINGSVGEAAITGYVDGDLRISGRVEENVNVWVDGTGVAYNSGYNLGCVSGSIWIDGAIDGSLWIVGAVGQSVLIDGTIGADVVVEGAIPDGYLHTSVGSQIGGIRLTLDSSIGEGAWIESHCKGDVVLEGAVGRLFYLSGHTEGRLDARYGGGEMWLSGTIVGGGRVRHSGINEDGAAVDATDIRSKINITRLAPNLEAPLYLGEGVSLDGCDFRYFNNYEHLRLVGSSLFSRRRGKGHLEFTGAYDRYQNHTEIADIHRRLRAVLEEQHNRAGAGDFYYGELQARRKAALERWKANKLGELASLGEWFVLLLYWLTSSYGLRAWQPLSLFFAVSITAAIAFHAGGLDLNPLPADTDLGVVAEADDATPLAIAVNDPNMVIASRFDAWIFSVQTMVNLFLPPAAELGSWGRLLQTVCRISGPLLLAQALFAIRERVAR